MQPTHLLVYSPFGCLVRELPEVLTVGRRNADLVVPAVEVSRRQCRIFRHGQGFLVEDDTSSSGTYLNRGRIVQPTPIAVGDRIRFGDTTLMVDDRFPAAFVTHETLPERGAPIGPELVVGDPGWRIDFPMRKDRGHQGRTELTIRRTTDGFRTHDRLDASIVGRSTDDQLRDGDRLRLGTRGVLVFHEGRPPEPVREVFFDSPLASLADLLVSEDEGFREQGASLLEVVSHHERGAEVLDALRLAPRLGPATGHADRPGHVGFDEPALVGPRRAAFQYMALHLLAANASTTESIRRSIESLWIGYVPPEPWWLRRKLGGRPPRLTIDVAPLLALPRLRELVIENARAIVGPPIPQVRAVSLLGCEELGDYRKTFPGVVRWDAHRPIGYEK